MTERITGMIDRLSDAEDYNSISWILEAPVENIALSAVDDTMKTNADFQREAGLESSVTRYTEPSGNWPCDWCQGLEGTYSIDDYPAELFMHHERCRCVIEWDNKQTGTHDTLRATTRSRGYWQKIDPAEIEGRKNFVGVNTQPQKIATNDMAIKYGKENYAKVQSLVDTNADEELQAVWNKYIDDVEVKSTTWTDTPRFSSQTEGIYLNLQEDASGNWYKSPWGTTAHETNHNIDYLAGMWDNSGYYSEYKYYSTAYKDGAFRDAILEDYNNLIKGKERVIKQAIKEWDLDALRSMGLDPYEIEWEGMKYKKAYTYKALAREINSLDPKNGATLSDMISGASKNKVKVRIGHSTKYWKLDETKLEKEAFAEFGEAEISNPDALKLMKEYFPKSYETYKEMLRALI